MKKQFIILLFLSLVSALPASAQTYKGAVGLRLGFPVSVSAKYFVSEKLAAEAFVGTRGYSSYRWFNAGGALLLHAPLDFDGELEGLTYYYGAGLNAYFWNYDGVLFNDEPSTTFGISGYLGLDYAFEDIPLNVTFDWAPTVFFNGLLGGWGGRYGGLGVRYVFAR